MPVQLLSVRDLSEASLTKKNGTNRKVLTDSCFEVPAQGTGLQLSIEDFAEWRNGGLVAVGESWE